ncbi:MAG: clostripain-related cysteine peptidase [Chloroflexales bacterium]
MKRLLLIVAVSLTLLGTLLAALMPRPARAATLTVTSAEDSGPGTLRQALLDAAAGDTITFNSIAFPPNGPRTILLQSPLPSLERDGLTIDASGAFVVLDGSSAGAGTNGLIIAADGCAIRGLTIQHFASNGIRITAGSAANRVGGDRSVGGGPNGQGNRIVANGNSGVEIHGIGADGNLLLGNYIGTDVTGQFADGNAYNGVAIWQGARSNVVGSTSAGQGNLIGGNVQNGVWIGGVGSDSNKVIGNYIGTRADGGAAVPNGVGDPGLNTRYSGVAIDSGARSNQIGDASAGAGNLISGNVGSGIYIADAGTSNNLILGNIIGANRTGTQVIGQGYDGVMITLAASGNEIGNGTAPGRNLISGNSMNGVQLTGPSTLGNRLLDNYVGTNLAGTAALPNGNAGVDISQSAHDNTIGLPGQGNLLSGNNNHGLVITSGAHDNMVRGNTIGPDVSGSVSLGHHPFGGIDIADGADRNQIGGLDAGEGNLVSGNATDGIALFDTTGSGTDDNKVLYNLIGLARDGSTPLPNRGAGVGVLAGATGTLVQGNQIADNEGPGVWVGRSARTRIVGNTIWRNQGEGVRIDTCAGNTISQNALYDNGGVGITSACPAAPTISALRFGASETVSGKAPPNATVEIFAGEDDEGRTFEAAVTADGSGAFSYTRSGAFRGSNLTLTSTDSAGNTSAFSPVAHLQWTLLLYFSGDNNLSADVAETVKAIVASGPSPRASVLALVDRSGPADTALYDLTRGQLTELDAGERNMGAGQTLVDFVNNGRLRYPARHTMLAILDHGGGWAPSEGVMQGGGLPGRRRFWMAGGSGLSWDDSSDYDYLSNVEIRQALGAITAAGGPLDVIHYDACLMGMIEVAAQIQGYAQYFVSSQNIAWSPIGDNGRYRRLLQGIPALASPRQMAELLAQAYADSMPPSEHPYTIAALDMAGLPALVTATDQLAVALATQITDAQQAAALHEVYLQTQKVDYDTDLKVEAATDGFVDLYDFASRVLQRYTNPAVDTAAQAVQDRLSAAVVAERHQSGRPWMLADTPESIWALDGLHGLSIFLPLGEDLELRPPDASSLPPQGYPRLRSVYTDELRFVAETRWKAMIDAYYAAVNTPVPVSAPGQPVTAQLPPDLTSPRTVITVAGEFAADQSVTINWDSQDSQSGIGLVTFLRRLPLGQWEAVGTTHAPSGSFTYTASGPCDDVAVYAVDAAGNAELITEGVNAHIRCDMVLPLIAST